MALVGADVFSVTAGGEGSIFVWKFDSTQLKFNHLLSLEGHLRGVTGLVIQGSIAAVFYSLLGYKCLRRILMVLFFGHYYQSVGA